MSCICLSCLHWTARTKHIKTQEACNHTLVCCWTKVSTVGLISLARREAARFCFRNCSCHPLLCRHLAVLIHIESYWLHWYSGPGLEGRSATWSSSLAPSICSETKDVTAMTVQIQRAEILWENDCNWMDGVLCFALCMRKQTRRNYLQSCRWNANISLFWCFRTSAKHESIGVSMGFWWFSYLRFGTFLHFTHLCTVSCLNFKVSKGAIDIWQSVPTFWSDFAKQFQPCHQPNRKRLLQMQFSALHIVGSKTELKCEIRWIPMTVWISSAGTCPRSPDPHSPNCQWQLRQLIRAQLVRIQCSNIAAEEWSSNISTT